jgi:hypothetical protein
MAPDPGPYPPFVTGLPTIPMVLDFSGNRPADAAYLLFMAVERKLPAAVFGVRHGLR